RVDPLVEIAGEPLVVEARRVREAGKTPDAVSREMAAQPGKVGRVAEEPVHQHHRHRVRTGAIEGIARDGAPGEGADDPDEGGDLAPEDPHGCESSRPASRVLLALHLAPPTPRRARSDARSVPEVPTGKARAHHGLGGSGGNGAYRPDTGEVSRWSRGARRLT